MILPESRYQSSYKPRKQDRKPKLALLIFAVVLLLGLIAGLFFLLAPNGESETEEEAIALSPSLESGDPQVLWKQAEYDQVIQWAEQTLEQDPFDVEGLIYHGMASFYHGIGQFTQEEQIPYFDQCITSLRRALVFEEIPLRPQVYYVLGKAYYHKGRYYSDLALHYLHASMDAGYEGEDSLEYLGLAYGEIEKYSDSLHYFVQAVEKRPSDILYLTIGQTYDKMDLDSEAESYLLRAISSTDELDIEQESRFLLGKIYMDQREFDQAETQYRKILEKDKRSADAYYYLGEIFEEQEHTVKARAEWRRCLEIDPSHYGALTKLY